MEVPKQKIPEGIEKRDCALYGISGWFSDTTLGENPNAVAFGGYFRYDKKLSLIVDGQMSDIFGSSTIEGHMYDEKIDFMKFYDCRNYPIFYEFSKENDIWVGHYKSHFVKGTEAQPVKAIITLIEPDAFDIVCGKPKIKLRL